MNGAEVFAETLSKVGVQYVFGVPGTTEVGLIDALAAQEKVQYILTLHESIAVAMADGLARGTGIPGVVSVHATVGTANTLGMLINAFEDNVPVIMSAGIKDQRSLGTGVFCDSPYQITDLLQQYTKWSWQVLEPSCMGRDLVKAFRTAQNPPAGPVFIGVPENFWTYPGGSENELSFYPGQQFRGDAERIDLAVSLLAGSVRPVMIAGNEIGRSRSLDEAISFAEHWQIPVFSEERPSWTSLNFPTDHPLYCGSFNYEAPLVREADVVISVGARMFMPMEFHQNRYFSPATKVVQINADPGRIGTHVPVELAILSHAGPALRDLLAASQRLDQRFGQNDSAVRQKRLRDISAFKESKRRSQEKLLQEARESDKIRVQLLIHELSRQTADDAVIVNEGVRSGFYLQDYYDFHKTRAYVGTTGGCLGWGLGAAMGVKLGSPGRQVIAFSGDGSFLFSPQALWTAAHYGIGIKTVICNNGAYMAVKGSLLQHKGPGAARGKFVGVDLTEPAVHFPSLCQSFGVPIWRAENPGQLADQIRGFLKHPGPAVLEVLLDQKDMEQRPQ